MDYLHIKGLKVSTRIGVHAWEQRIEQLLIIDITISADFHACEDKLDNTLDYDELCQRITHFVESHSFKLIETVANKVADLIKNEFKVKQLTVEVSKPQAIKNANTISVLVNR